jgi:phage-related protein
MVKPTEWISDAKDELSAMPDEVREEIGFALFYAQQGSKHESAKPLKGFGGAGVLEIVSKHDGDAYRGVYTVKFEGVVYVLHVFQKKSKKGNETPQPEIDLIKSRLKLAEEHYKTHYRKAG